MEQHTYTVGIYFRIPPRNGIPIIPLIGNGAQKWLARMSLQCLCNTTI